MRAKAGHDELKAAEQGAKDALKVAAEQVKAKEEEHSTAMMAAKATHEEETKEANRRGGTARARRASSAKLCRAPTRPPVTTLAGPDQPWLNSIS